MTEPSKGFVMSFSEGSLDVLTHCEEMIREARQWAQSCAWVDQLDIELGTEQSRSFYDQQMAAVEAMERSLHTCVFRLISLAGPGGGIEIYSDGEASLFWRVAHGLHGGLNWHANSYGQTRLPVGSWSLNT